MNYSFAITVLIIMSILLFIGILTRSNVLKKNIFYISSMFAALFFFELYVNIIYVKNNPKVSFNCTFIGKDSILGYGPVFGSMQVGSQCKIGDENIYDVTYQIEDGKRIVPEAFCENRSYAIFLGCSFVFGEGLEDSCTLPYFFNRFTNNQYNVINYAFSGYGPHQAIAIVERKLFNEIDTTFLKGSVAYYTLMCDHFRRAAGKSEWDWNGPCYQLNLTNELEFKGSFSDYLFLYPGYKMMSIWRCSGMYRVFFNKISESYSKDVLLTLKILEKMNNILEQRGIHFIVVFTPEMNDQLYFNFITNYFKENNIQYLTLLDKLPSDVFENCYLKDGYFGDVDPLFR